MPRLIIQSGVDGGKVHFLQGDRSTIGRSVNNDLQIIDRRMSRTHAEIIRQNREFFIRDAGSKNGTLVNGAPLRDTLRLTGGDLIQVGDTLLVFEDEDTHSSSESHPVVGTIRRRDSSGVKLIDERQWGATRGEVRAGILPSGTVTLQHGEERAVRDLNRRLEIIYQVTEAIRSFFALDELLEQIMEIINDVIQPDRAYLLLKDEQTQQLVPEIIKSRQADDIREVKVSTSIVDRCMKEGISLLVSDAAADDRFATSESIIVNRIRTAMVAPLIYKEDTLGVVYVDTHTRTTPFTQEELELLTGISNQAAVAISNARLHSQLVEQHKIAREMELARGIQMNLLPKVYPTLPGYEISAMSLPAKHVGGDYYDFLQLPDGRIALAIADVSGKGMPAAILTATTRSYLQSETQHPGSSIVRTVERINRMVHRDVMNDMYVTMALIYINAEDGALEYINAGHTHPILMDPNGNIRFLDRGGLFLGILESTEYECEQAQMNPGDLLVLATDGVMDIQNPAGEPFGAERFYELLRTSLHLSSEGIRNRVYQACLEHRGDADQFDDFTLIVLKRLRHPGDSVDELDFD